MEIGVLRNWRETASRSLKGIKGFHSIVINEERRVLVIRLDDNVKEVQGTVLDILDNMGAGNVKVTFAKHERTMKLEHRT